MCVRRTLRNKGEMRVNFVCAYVLFLEARVFIFHVFIFSTVGVRFSTRTSRRVFLCVCRCQYDCSLSRGRACKDVRTPYVYAVWLVAFAAFRACSESVRVRSAQVRVRVSIT